jgi:hypothetical protein
MATNIHMNPQQIAVEHFKAIEELFPHLPEPHKGSISYVLQVAKDPAVDRAFCQRAGKVVHITAELAEKIALPVTIRGNPGPLDWNTDYNADPQGDRPNFFERSFTIPISPAHNDDILEFKLCIPAPDLSSKMRWSAGNNWTVDLSKYGHVVTIDLSKVAFS